MIPNAPGCAGFSYVEILVAVALLALCTIPLAGAVKNGLDGARVAEAKAKELRCTKNLMETVLAEPFDTLWGEARGNAEPSSYSKPVDGECLLARQVFIAKYQRTINAGAPVFPEGELAEDSLLLVTVASGASGYTFATLVDR